MKADVQRLRACPFCGHTPIDVRDFLHPTGSGWRDDPGVGRHYMRWDDPRGVHGKVWAVHCLEHEGGCGARVTGDSRDEAIAAWNRRTPDADLLAIAEAYNAAPIAEVTREDWLENFTKFGADLIGQTVRLVRVVGE